jgi:hypothetical protein
VLLSIFTIPVLPAPFIISKVPVILLFHKEALLLDKEVCIVLFINVEDTLAVPVIVVLPLIPILPPLIFVAVFDVRPKVDVVAVPFPIVRVVALSILVDFTFPTMFMVGAVTVIEVVPVIGIVLPLILVIPVLFPNVDVVAVPVPKLRVVALSMEVDFIPNASKLFVPVHTLLDESKVVPALRDEDTYE